MDHGRLRWAIQEFWIRAKRRFSIIFFNVEVIFWTNVLSQKSNLYHVNLMQWTLFTPSKAQAQPSRESEQVGQNWKKNVLWFVNIVIIFYDFHKLVIGVIFYLSFFYPYSFYRLPMWYHMMHSTGGAWRRRWPSCAGSLSAQKIFQSVTVITSWRIISWKPPTVPQIFWSATKKMSTEEALMVCVRWDSKISARLILTFFLSTLKYFGRIIFGRSAISEIICCFGFYNVHICEKWTYSILKKWGSTGNDKYNW